METDGYRSLGPKTFWAFVIKNSGAAGIFLLITIAILIAKKYLAVLEFVKQYVSMFNNVILIGFLLAALIELIAFLISLLQYSRFKFKLDIDSFKIIRGVLTAQEIAIPYRRIEAVDIKEPLWFQLLGISRITIETTADSGLDKDNKQDSDDEVLPAIDRRLALEIQEELTRRANTQKMSVQNR